MDWCPQHAMKAYLHTLHLCKLHGNDGEDEGRVIEPKCMELISALAAGKQARLILQITTKGLTPLSIALAVAAKHTRGRFVCINLAPQGTSLELLASYDLQDAVELVQHGPSDPCEAVKQYTNIDFAVIDCELEERVKVLMGMNVSPRGYIVVVNDIGVDQHRRSHGTSFAEVLKKKKIGVDECVTVPIGQGMELTRVGSRRGRKLKRFHVTFEN